MNYIPTLEDDFIVDDGIRALLAGNKIHKTDKGYGQVWYKSKRQSLQRLVMGKAPEGLEIDHINNNKLDNRRENLQFVTKKVNLRKRPSWSKSGIKGVYLDQTVNRAKPWKADFRRDGVTHNVGYFATPEEAQKARSEAVEIFDTEVEVL